MLRCCMCGSRRRAWAGHHGPWRVIPMCAWEKNFIWSNQVVKTSIGGSEAQRALFKHLRKVAMDITEG